MKKPLPFLFLALIIIISTFWRVEICYGQDYDYNDGGKPKAAPPPEVQDCNGIFLSYTFISRVKELPHVKNVSAQAWAFKAEAAVLNAGKDELKAWKMFVGFQHDEILVSVDGAVVMDGGDFPMAVGNGTYFSGFSLADLKTAIETAGDYDQIQATVGIIGTMFGLKPKAVPMPKTIRLENDGFQCPAPHRHGTSAMYVCCKSDPKYKAKTTKTTKFLPRQNGDLSFTYDIIQAFSGNYLAQVTIDNNNSLGRLDHWNLTWEWTRGEFIYAMRGAYTHRHDSSDCIYGPAGLYYKDLDFSQVMNCQKKPTISDLPADRAEDEKVGKLPFCCRNGTLLPPQMDSNKSRSIFQLQVYKVPPDVSNRTTFYPPQKWQVDGVLNPDYKCGSPLRVDPTEFPDPSGLQSVTTAIASWQVVCNITRPKTRHSRCCVSFSAYYNDSVVPCNTCACGCGQKTTGSFDITTTTCDPEAQPLLLPPEALLVPFANRTEKAKAWARIKHNNIPKTLPCPDNCGLSMNWHINTDYKSGWTARITLFNWLNTSFDDWFAAIQMKKAYPGYENVYSFNGTRLPDVNNTIFLQGLPGLNYLMGMTNGTNPRTDPRVPGKQQSVISFAKKRTPGIDVRGGDGFPTKVFFNGEECEIPVHFPTSSSRRRRAEVGLGLPVLVAAALTFVLVVDRHLH
ncbi:COBRA-like protein 10 [Morus notabilis]|uniref:COBRA-like protein 10 n=1 Tax=Morus notabilis TaxID=981085 RepID=UPI000CED3ED4|nr:COBRA-like protein 10 [Morus notabilis]